MTAIVVCCHTELAHGFMAATEMIAGRQEQFYALDFQVGESLMSLIPRIAECIDQSGAERALVFVDLFGASPANAAAVSIFSVHAETAIITGANLAAILEAALTRSDEEPLDTFASRICDAGRDNMRVVTKHTVENAGGANL